MQLWLWILSIVVVLVIVVFGAVISTLMEDVEKLERGQRWDANDLRGLRRELKAMGDVQQEVEKLFALKTTTDAQWRVLNALLDQSGVRAVWHKPQPKKVELVPVGKHKKVRK
jgi:hypothetical protein